MKTVFTVSFFVCMMLIASIAWSEIVYVNGTTGDDATGERGNPDKPFKTIQKGIDVALNGDIVLVADGTYTGAGNRDIDFKGKAPLTVMSVYGAEFTIIDCDGTEQTPHRGVYFHNNENEWSVLTGFTIRGGYGPIGGQFGNNVGGGIFCENSSPSIINNVITQNQAYEGGGIYCEFSSPHITNNIISGNTADNGGGIHCNIRSSPNITGNVIKENTARYAAGVNCYNSSAPIISRNVILENSSESFGAGIYCDGQYSSAIIENNLIVGNSAYSSVGGAIDCFDSSPHITTCTIVGNSAYRGGGIYCGYGSSPTVFNTILWNDSPQEICFNSSGDPNTVTISYSCLQGGLPGIVTNDNGEVIWLEGNIDADPLFVDPDNGIYYLQAGSPCLSVANCEGAPETDKDGQPRPLGSGCDMGCYEECDKGIFGYISSANCDISAYDASLVLRSIVGLIDLSERQKIAADVTGNGTVTALDAALILQYTVGLITQFPVQKGAPILTVKDENQILTKIIAELENVSLTTEQKYVLEQLNHLIWQQSLPGHTTLLQNYPNPFNPETWIPYKLAKDASVTISIYNVKGQLIRALHLGNKNAGVYMTKDRAAHWDGKDSLGQTVASGIYFYTLQVEHHGGNGASILIATRKMVIMK